MTLEEAVKDNRMLLVELPQGGRRVIAELFVVSHGILFFDVYWDIASLNPLHFLRGDFIGENPWKSTKEPGVVIRTMTEDDDEVIQWLNWKAYLLGTGKLTATREIAAKEVEKRVKEVNTIFDKE
jgi:hypothetical protein